MKNNLYASNYKFLSQNQTLIKSFDTDVDNNPIISFKKVNEDNYYVKTKEASLFLNSLYNKLNEAEKTLEHLSEDVETVFLFGIGNGKTLRFLYKRKNKIKNIVVIEPSLTLFENIMGIVDIASIVRSDSDIKFHILINRPVDYVNQYLSKIGRDLAAGKIGFAITVSYSILFEKFYHEFHDVVRDSTNRLTVNTVTKSTVGTKLWPINTLFNIKKKHMIIEDCVSPFQGLPVLLVMAGPSLNKNIHLVNAAKEKLIVIAVGSAINILDRNGIEPHFRIAIDGMPAEEIIFKSLKNENIPLLYAGQVFAPIIEKYKGTCINVTLETNFLEQYIYKEAGIEKQYYRSGFSVANTALDVACRAFKAPKVVLIGQDLSVSDKWYADGRDDDKDKIDNSEKRFVEAFDIHGEKIYTLLQFISIKKMQESIAKDNNQVELINATEGGLLINHFKNMTLESVLNDMDNYNYNVSEEIQMISKRLIDDDNYILIRKSLLNLKEDLLDINVIVKKCFLGIKEINKQISRDLKINRIKSKFEDVNKLGDDFSKFEFNNRVIDNVNYSIYYAIEKSLYSSDEDVNIKIEIFSKKLTALSNYVNLLLSLL